MDIHLRNNFKDNKPLYRLWHLLHKVVSDKKLASAATSMEEKIQIFNELRESFTAGGSLTRSDGGSFVVIG
jgi:hypothetical protein